MSPEEIRSYLFNHLSEEARTFWGERDVAYLEKVTGDWLDETGSSGAQYRIERIRSLARSCSAILDMGAGCGTFIRYAMRLGFNAWGIEPAAWKVTVARHVLHSDGAPLQILRGVGEHLPFDDDSFDCVTTFQTLEHVQDVAACCREMVRVTRPGGGIYIHCPDYALSTYEGHYRLPWLPGLWGSRAQRYLQWRGRPIAGLRSLQPVSTRTLRSLFTAIGRDLSIELEFMDADYVRIRQRLHLPDHPVVYGGLRPLFLARYCRMLFRADYPVHCYVKVVHRKEEK